MPSLIEVGERLFGAEVDLYDKPDERARVLQRQLDVYNEAEGNLEKHVKKGLVTQADLERLRYDPVALPLSGGGFHRRPSTSLLPAKQDHPMPRVINTDKHTAYRGLCAPSSPE